MDSEIDGVTHPPWTDSLSTYTPLDTRTDQEILAQLQTYQPIDQNSPSERNIWAFWDRGLAACKPWCQRNIISWVRRHGKEWTVRVIDMVEGSPNHYSKFIPPDFFPSPTFLEKGLAGAHVGPHASDLVRLPLLYLYGGVWVDTGFMLFRNLNELCWNRLEDPASPYEMAGFRMTITPETCMFWNGLIAARRSSTAVKLWHDLFLKLWVDTGSNSTVGMHKHPLLRHLPWYQVPSETGEPPAFDYSLYVDYLAQMFCCERLRHLKDPCAGWDGPAYFADKVLLYECVSEVYWAQHLTYWDGRQQFELLSRQADPPARRDDDWHEADDFVTAILKTSSTMKFSHGIVTQQREYLARIWDQPENTDADIAPGTFASRLRWASVYFRQEKQLEPLDFPLRENALLTGGLLDEVGGTHPDWDGHL